MEEEDFYTELSSFEDIHEKRDKVSQLVLKFKPPDVHIFYTDSSLLYITFDLDAGNFTSICVEDSGSSQT